MEITETIIVPKDTMSDIIHCMEVMVELLGGMKAPTEEELNKIKYVNKIFFQAMELFNNLQAQLNKKP